MATVDPDKALEKQKQFLVNAEAMVDTLPLLGHAKVLNLNKIYKSNQVPHDTMFIPSGPVHN